MASNNHTAVTKTQDELREALEHVEYELKMLVYCAHALSDNALPQGTRNALLESFCLHVRSIADFFFKARAGGGKAVDDIFARDFVATWDPGDRKIYKGGLLETAWTRAGAELAHLSFKRIAVKPENKAWDVAALATAIMELWRLFDEKLPDELRIKRPGLEAPLGASETATTYFQVVTHRNDIE